MKKVWCMNLKDNRNEDKRNKDPELKFRLCKEKGIIAIGWGASESVNTWQEYLEVANRSRQGDKGYAAATNALKEMTCGDLVWIKDPGNGDFYLVEIVDTSHDPSICSNLIEFDICAYRRCRYIRVEPSCLTGPLSREKLRATQAIERVHKAKRNDVIEATLELFKILKE